MKKIGILFGKERSFPEAFVERVNSKKVKGITAEPVSIDKVMQGEASDYAVIIDRISQDVPFYRAFLKNTALCGTAVINNPFWWSADEKFFNNALAEKVGVPVPKTVLLPSNVHPEDTSAESFSNLAFPLAWEEMFEALKKYKKIHGDTLVPRRYSNDPQLGTWVDTQRLNRKKNKLITEIKGNLQV